MVWDSPVRIRITETPGETRSYWRADGPLPTAAELAALAGRYVSREAGATYVVSVEDGRLTVRVDGRPRFVLRPPAVGPDVFGTASLVLRVHRQPSGAVRALTLSMARVRELELVPVSAATGER